MFKGVPCVLRHPDQQSRFLSVFEHCRVLASPYSIHVVLDTERLSKFLVRTSGHTWSGLIVAWTFVSLLPDHIRPLGGLSFDRVNFVNPFLRIRQTSVRVDIPVVNQYVLLHDILISVNSPCSINVFQWKKECFFLRHSELNSRFIVLTIDEVTLDRPEVGTDFSVIFWFCRLRLSRFALKFSTEIFAPYRSSRLGEFVVSSWQLCFTICLQLGIWIPLTCVISMLLSRWFSEDKYLLHPTFPVLPDLLQNISFPHSTRDLCTPKKDSRQIDDLLLKSGDIQPLLQKELLTEFPRLPRGLGHVADKNSISLKQPTIFHPILIAAIQKVPSFTLRTALSAIPLVSDRRGIEVQ